MTREEPAEDWTEPGPHRVRTGVHRIPLPLPGNALRAVNSYLVEDSDGLVLVDAGWAAPDTEKTLRQALAALGHRLEDLTQVLVTHAHWDHYTQALALAELLGPRVRIGRGEQLSIEAFDLAEGFYPRQAALLRRCGAPRLAERIAAYESAPEERDMPFGPPDGWLEDGERIPLGDRVLDVLATPGHTRGHIVLRDAAAGLLFAGDHVLPHITPALGLESVPEPKPLRSYLDSLRLVGDLPDTLLLPAHGPVTPSVRTRVDELLAHHEERLDAVLARVRAGEATAHQVAAGLPWTRRARQLAELDLISQMLAVTETDAHLDLLSDQELLVSEDVDGVRYYALR
ncbi:beta-lactamase class B [Streptomyces albus]|uniref:Beta-lactamase class B n=1 Tax=Streptomyces albus (strain ATCC 21838 / DSM 41398 / FERM P-419 / JCM 4703 / NBRC 107858) TaxID=1081613 RepID=A0A0B5EQI7_STRA4|nr:beta-lactamase class B [Streptomyces albus]AOU74742.1 beta-lactamase class B [Streptomyces albus]AYN30553.1 MBL fold metallo-hydrolase [Streptomyces albus]